VLTTKSQEEFLLDLGQIPDGNLKREYLKKLKSIILKEENKMKHPVFQTLSGELRTIML